MEALDYARRLQEGYSTRAEQKISRESSSIVRSIRDRPFVAVAEALGPHGRGQRIGGYRGILDVHAKEYNFEQA